MCRIENYLNLIIASTNLAFNPNGVEIRYIYNSESHEKLTRSKKRYHHKGWHHSLQEKKNYHKSDSHSSVRFMYR